LTLGCGAVAASCFWRSVPFFLIVPGATVGWWQAGLVGHWGWVPATTLGLMSGGAASINALDLTERPVVLETFGERGRTMVASLAVVLALAVSGLLTAALQWLLARRVVTHPGRWLRQGALAGAAAGATATVLGLLLGWSTSANPGVGDLLLVVSPLLVGLAYALVQAGAVNALTARERAPRARSPVTGWPS
jgi:hypothetical protein